jgi:hypothetical protein
MKVKELDNITGSLSKPSKMPGWAYGIPAKECQTGAKLREVKGSTCYNCYALRVAMSSLMYKMHNTSVWRQHVNRSGSKQWLPRYYATSQNGLDGTTLETYNH